MAGIAYLSLLKKGDVDHLNMAIRIRFEHKKTKGLLLSLVEVLQQPLMFLCLHDIPVHRFGIFSKRLQPEFGLSNSSCRMMENFVCPIYNKPGIFSIGSVILGSVILGVINE